MKKGLTVLAVVLLLGFGAVGVGIKVASRDIPPPDESFFIVERADVAPDRNAYTYFLLATNVLFEPADSCLLSEYLAGQPVDEGEIRKIVEKNSGSLAIIRRGIGCTIFQSPPLEGYGTETPNLCPWLTLANVMACEAHLARLKGRYAESVSSCMDELRFGGLIQGGGGGLSQYLIGVSIIQKALAQVQALAWEQGISLAELAQLAEGLEKLDPGANGLARSMKAEYWQMSSTLDTVLERSKPGPDWLKKFKAVLPDRSQGSNYTFHPNRSKSLAADSIRLQMGNILKVYAEMQVSGEGDVKFRKRDFFKPNGAGRMLMKVLEPSMQRALLAMCRTQGEIQGTRLVVACNRFENEKRHWPESLQELVPAYLDAVPKDPFDGEPFRYSAEKGIVYSVGPNLMDDGGSRKIWEGLEDCPKGRQQFKTEDQVYEIRPTESPDE